VDDVQFCQNQMLFIRVTQLYGNKGFACLTLYW